VEESKDIIAGLAGVKLEPTEYSLGSGLRISRTYAHMMAHFMMAYSPAKPGQPHPGPWSPVSGGAFTYDIYTQLEVPRASLVGLDLDTSFIAWWITSMLRLRLGPVFIVPVIGEQTFAEAKIHNSKARFYPVEIYNQILVLDPNARHTIYEVDLAWTAKYWLSASRLYQGNDAFRVLFEAVDQSMFARHRSLALLWLWGGLEAVFSPSKAELRYRISSAIASFLEEPGIPRMNAQKSISKLYDSRSAAAHGREDKKDNSLQDTYALARRAVVTMIENNRVPSKVELEAKIFGAEVK
jgi:hypothetical protein